MPPKISIIIINYNGKKDTLECLASLEKVNYPHFEIILVDNGSKDDSVQEISTKYPSIDLIETHQNLGFSEGNNVGIKKALQTGTEYFLLLNNDTTVDPDFLSGFVQATIEEPSASILGAKIYQYHHPHIIDHLGGMWNKDKGEFESTAQGFLEDHKTYEHMQKVDYVCGCAFFIKREVIETIGFLEPHFFLLWEETDYCYRAQQYGFEIWTAPQAKIWHKISSSFTGGKPQMHYFWWRNRLLFVKRNFKGAEKKSLYQKVLLKEIFQINKRFVLKSLQLILMRSFSSQEKINKQKEKINRYRAGCKGIFHFLIGRFGNGYTFPPK